MECEDIYVDLDGTLIRTDLLFESTILLLKRNVFYIFLLPVWLAKGRAHLKNEIASRVAISPETLPYNHEVLTYLDKKKKDGHRLLLATASNFRYAESVAEHLDIFDGVLASDRSTNLKSKAKLAAITRQNRPFSYLGDSEADYIIFQASKLPVLVSSSRTIEKDASRHAGVDTVIPVPSAGNRDIIRCIRMYQWSKNLLLFVPLIVSGNLNQSSLFADVSLTFLAFSLLASSTYILNDIFDIQNDRQHPRKRFRAIPSGLLSVPRAVTLAFSLLLTAYAITGLAAPAAVPGLTAYLALTLFYTYVVKSYVLMDVICLAALYTARILIGAWVIAVEPSIWLLAFSMFLFVSLALVKRVSELHTVKKEKQSSSSGRDYNVSDTQLLVAMGAASAFNAVLVVTLYMAEGIQNGGYHHPNLIWLVEPVLLYWLGRIWIKTTRGEMTDDPIVFSFRDKGSLVCAACIATIILGALYL